MLLSPAPPTARPIFLTVSEADMFRRACIVVDCRGKIATLIDLPALCLADDGSLIFVLHTKRFDKTEELHGSEAPNIFVCQVGDVERLSKCVLC